MASSEQRGFAAMEPERQREIASQGGRAAHQQGTAHEFTPEEARAAGRKGGEVVSQNREHMAQIGRKGGEASRRSARAAHSGAQNRPARTPGSPEEQHRTDEQVNPGRTGGAPEQQSHGAS